MLSNGICPSVGRTTRRDGTARDGRSGAQPVAVGGDPDQVAVLDNFCWGDPTKPDRLGSLVRAVQGCTDGARTYRMPFISGKDSLFNEFDGEAIPGTLLISALGLVPDLRRAVDSAGMQIGDDLWLVGANEAPRRLACVGSFRSRRHSVPTRLMTHCRVTGRSTLRSATARSPQPSCSEGGLAVAVSEMAIAARLGVSVVVPLDGLDPFTALVNEAPGRLVLSAARSTGTPWERSSAIMVAASERSPPATTSSSICSTLRGEDSNLEPIRIPLADAVSASTHGPSGPTRGATA